MADTKWMDRMSLTPENIAFISRLSRLALTPEETTGMVNHLNQFFDTVVAPMQEVDTTGLLPMAHPTEVLQEVALRLREDVASLREAAAGFGLAMQSSSELIARSISTLARMAVNR